MSLCLCILQNSLLELARIVKAKEQVVAGKMYHLTLEADDGGKHKINEAKVWVKPWMNFKHLQEFKEVCHNICCFTTFFMDGNYIIHGLNQSILVGCRSLKILPISPSKGRERSAETIIAVSKILSKKLVWLVCLYRCNIYYVKILMLVFLLNKYSKWGSPIVTSLINAYLHILLSAVLESNSMVSFLV